MILSFKERFKPKILEGTKIHTIREDPFRRWKTGRTIHFATGVRTKNYKQFKEGVCKRLQQVIINPPEEVYIGINGRTYPILSVRQLAINDGFDSEEEFWEWFDKPFNGVIIHWTPFVYS